MKWFILLCHTLAFSLVFMSITLITGCGDNKSGVVSQSTPPAIRVSEFTYKGHHYLFFASENNAGAGGIVHDPNCPIERKAQE